jgi:ubiquinone/menaquinone biosynthesis C-methylase UbiE
MRSTETTDRFDSVADASAPATWRDVFAAALGARPRHVLDVGCGDGDAAFLLWDLGHYPQGVDVSSDRVRRARSTARDRCAAVAFQLGDAERLDFGAGVFDAVVARDVLDALPNPARALAEWSRVLKPGGVVVVGDSAASTSGRDRIAEFLRTAGFAHVESRELPANSGAAAPWYRRRPRRAGRCCVAAWGTRP